MQVLLFAHHTLETAVITMAGQGGPAPVAASPSLWETWLVSAGAAVLGGVVGGGIAWLTARGQMSRTANVTFVSAALGAPGASGALANVFSTIRDSTQEIQTLTPVIENEAWFQLLTARAPKSREEILNRLSAGDREGAINALRELLAGRFK